MIDQAFEEEVNFFSSLKSQAKIPIRKLYESIREEMSTCASAFRNQEKLLILPASHDVEDWMDLPANQVYMKAGRQLDGLRQALDRHGRLDGAMAVCNCGMEGEGIYPHLTDMPGERGYFTVVFSPNGEGK